MLARLFLRVNGAMLKFNLADAVTLMRGVAGGTVTEPALAAWFRDRIVAE